MNWRNVELGKLCEVLDSKRKPITKRFRTEGNYPYYGATGIVDYVGNFIFDEKLVLIGEDGAKWGTGEKTAFIAEGKYWVNNHAHVVKPNRDLLLDEWLVYYLYHKDLKEFVTGLTVPKLNQGQLKIIPIPLPPLASQKRIVEKLDAIFAEIDKATAAYETNARNAEALFQSLLRNALNSENLVKLSTITSEITDGDHQPPPKATEGVPFITISNVNKVTREIDFSNTFKVSKEYFNALKKKRKPILGDVLYTVTGSFGIPIHVSMDSEFCFQRHIGLIRPSDNTDSRWLFWLMLSPQVFQQASDSATGAAQLTVSLKAIRNFNVPSMTLSEQKKIGEVLDTCFSQIKNLENSYNKRVQELIFLKKSLLTKAFCGELIKE